MKKILLIFGTRPEAIKMAPLFRALSEDRENFRVSVCVTAQHREMLDQVLNLFAIKPDYDLNIMKQGQDLFDITSRVISGLRDVLFAEKPDAVLVHGDTTTTMAAALAAFYMKIPVGHVEAGLRTGNIYSPWPEEMNRRLTGRIASFHFAPTEESRQNLLKENVPDQDIFVTGNTVIDALHSVVKKIRVSAELREELKNILFTAGYDTMRAERGRRLVLITGHRRENFGTGFTDIMRAIKTLCIKYSDVDFVYPIHMNPQVRRPAAEIFGDIRPENMFFTEPLDYLPFVFLMEKASVILTDSGGIQEEAPGLGKPVLVMRSTTERPEAVAAGTVKLTGTSFDRIVSETSLLLDDPMAYSVMARAINPYGYGKSSARICAILRERL